MNKKNRCFFLLGVLLWIFSGALNAAEELGPKVFSESENSFYRFSEHLPTDADVTLIKPEVYVKKGLWGEDRFLFPGLGPETDMVLTQLSLDGKPMEIIRFQSFSDFNRVMEFANVPPSARLVFYIKITPREKIEGKDKSINLVYMRLFAGKRLMAHLRLSPEEGWVKKSVPLQSGRFLKKKLNITLDVRGEDNGLEVALFGCAVS